MKTNTATAPAVVPDPATAADDLSTRLFDEVGALLRERLARNRNESDRITELLGLMSAPNPTSDGPVDRPSEPQAARSRRWSAKARAAASRRAKRLWRERRRK